jgi:hypothetical protein
MIRLLVVVHRGHEMRQPGQAVLHYVHCGLAADRPWAAGMDAAKRSAVPSKITADQIIGPLAATPINLGGNGMDQMAMRIKSAQ